ncbi:MAG: M28 family peptidase [Calditrichaeota bacterium]|nr:M28 family peptidase [Calditrichota bacterium]
MKRYISALVFLFIILLTACAKKELPSDAVFNAIDVNEIKANLTYLASDEMRGRDAFSEDILRAGEYIADKLKSYGYTGLGPNGSYFQDLEDFASNKYIPSSLEIGYNGKSLRAKLGTDWVAFSRAQYATDTKAQLYYVQSGNENEYDAEMLKGKIAVMKPSGANAFGNYRIARNLIRAGAKSVIWVISKSEDDQNLFNLINNFGSRPASGFGSEGESQFYIAIKEKTFATILKAEKMRSLGSESKVLSGEFSFSAKNESTPIHTRNVVAMLKGTDPNLNDQYVGYGAHYDHVGVGRAINGDSIYNGADDDGSGTVGLLAIAKSIAQDPPARSTFIIFHTAEEKGLLGSKYYADHPIIPLEKMVTVLNIDMIGRSKMEGDTVKANAELTGPNEIYLIGADRISQQLHDVSEMVNSKTLKMDLNYKYNAPDDPNSFYTRSDHYMYAEKGIPIIFYFNGTHEDYHRPSDEVEKIDFNKIKKVASLAMATGYYVSNMPQRLKIGTKLEQDGKDAKAE